MLQSAGAYDVGKILSLPLEQKIGQLFFIGISGAEVDANTIALLREISPGGICLFARNIKTAEGVRKLLDRFARVYRMLSHLLSIDQEGGLVDRLRRIIIADAVRRFD